MNKSELAQVVFEKCLKNSSKSERKDIALAKGAVELFFNNIQSALKIGDRIEIRSMGSFAVKDYDSYTGRNPRTGKKIKVKAKRLPYFKSGKNLKEIVNQD